MKLLLDQNLPRSLCKTLQFSEIEVSHVAFHNLANCADAEVWEWSGLNGFSLVSKDRDFSDMSVLFGPPPKVIWVRLGNCSAQDIKTLLANSAEAIKEFLRHPDAGLLVLPNKVLL